ncbi:MAG: hypothetical protein IKN98_10205 [Bacteroidales bacterium]|nr:hypothetical protein [Bacteroidales bacterium]
MDKKALIDKIKEIRETFKENEWCYRVSEENVRAEIIDPILRILGWRLPYIKREEHSMDYVLCSEKDIHVNSKVIVLEAKKFKEQLWYDNVKKEIRTSNPDQLEGYLTDNSILGEIGENHKIGVLTNGIRWYLCNSKKRIKKEITLVDINEQGELIKSVDYNEFCEFFELISFNRIDRSLYDLMEIEGAVEPHYEKKEQPQKICIKDKGMVEYKTNNGKFSHCNASYYVAKKADDMISMKQKDGHFNSDFSLINYFFHKAIVIVRKNKPERTSEYCEKHKYYYVGDYNIYDKIALLQEINTSLNLGLTIYLK